VQGHQYTGHRISIKGKNCTPVPQSSDNAPGTASIGVDFLAWIICHTNKKKIFGQYSTGIHEISPEVSAAILVYVGDIYASVTLAWVGNLTSERAWNPWA